MRSFVVRLNFKILNRTGKTTLARNFRSEFEQNFENSFSEILKTSPGANFKGGAVASKF
nr:hypothetical protein [uncultured Campylobacter sp.]